MLQAPTEEEKRKNETDASTTPCSAHDTHEGKEKKTRCFIMAEQPVPARYLKKEYRCGRDVGIARMLWLGGSGGAVEG